jgi:hypothetical protein
MSDLVKADPPPKPPARSRWTKHIVIGVVVLLLATACLVGVQLFNDHLVQTELQEALAEADRRDPGWRLEELEARRAAVPEEQNAGPRVLATAKHLPNEWRNDPLFEELYSLPPPVQLSEQQTTTLRGKLKEWSLAVIEARKVANFSQGRYPITWSGDFVSTLLPHLTPARDVANLLGYDVTLLLQEGEVERAFVSLRALRNVGRSIGDEPVLISQLVRLAIQRQTVQTLERTLAQGQPSPSVLATFQKLLDEEVAYPLLLVAIRGERAGFHRMMVSLETGELTLDKLGTGKNDYPKGKSTSDWSAGNLLRRSHAWGVDYWMKAIEIAKQPVETQAEPVQELQATLDDAPPIAALLLVRWDKVARAYQQSQAHLRCAITGLAVERYRRQHGQWPANLDILKAEKLLPQVLNDPVDGQPLRYRPTKDGVVIYSIGVDGRYKGDALDGNQPGGDFVRLEMRLWNVDRRRQPPLPAKPLEEFPERDPK